MALPRRDRESTRGTHGILTTVDWCFEKVWGLAERPSSTGERRKLDSGTKKVDNEVGCLGKLATAMKVARRILYKQETRGWSSH
jgi:hypothetical protein